ncbi:MAG: hypothetical protein NT037_18305, partial [Hyphomicrobiales bacterium]|nr:hypothetical protein [Hyphomicrobiales bacterium]
MHNGFARRDDAADSEHRKLVHHPVDRRADLGPAKLLLRGRPPLEQISNLVPGFTQVAGCLVENLLVDLRDLEFNFADPATRSRDLGCQFTGLPFQLNKRTPQGVDARNLCQPLSLQTLQIVQFLLGNRGLFHDRTALGFKPDNLFAGLGGALAQLRFLAALGASPRIKKRGFRIGQCQDFDFAEPAFHAGRKHNR